MESGSSVEKKSHCSFVFVGMAALAGGVALGTASYFAISRFKAMQELPRSSARAIKAVAPLGVGGAAALTIACLGRTYGCSASSNEYGKDIQSWWSTASPAPRTPESLPAFYCGRRLEEGGLLGRLVTSLTQAPPMDKGSMSGPCKRETARMEAFLKTNFGFQNIEGEWFVHGVRAFELARPPADLVPETSFKCTDSDACFAFSNQELAEWQQSYRVYADEEKLGEIEGEPKAFIQRVLRGEAEAGPEAFLMKYIVRVSQTPILSEFDGKTIPREIGEEVGDITLLSTCAIDFAGRIHDKDDIKRYITNWKEAFELDDHGEFKTSGGRDLIQKSVDGQQVALELDQDLLLEDLERMTRLRFKVLDELGIEIAVESAMGLGVFAGDRFGREVGEKVRLASAMAIKNVLETYKFKTLALLTFALPVFKPTDNYHVFTQVFQEYKGITPVLILDQDMHRIARIAATEEDGAGGRAKRFKVSELNPGDSHGVFGEYWQNHGPGTEEKLALTTLGLLTQHHAINPHVVEEDRYTLLSADV